MEEERRKAEEEAEKEKEKKKKKTKKTKKKKNDESAAQIAQNEKPQSEMHIDLADINTIRVDYFQDQIFKLLFTNHDESARVISIPLKEVSTDAAPVEEPENVEQIVETNLDAPAEGQVATEEAENQDYNSVLYKIHNGQIDGVHAKYKKELVDLVLWGAEQVIEEVEEEEVQVSYSLNSLKYLTLPRTKLKNLKKFTRTKSKKNRSI